MLIHGVTVTAELNWGKVFAPLARHFRVVAADLRGHGDGIRLRSAFRLEDCADDFAALAAALDIPRFTAVGYSMGGMVAQLLYKRHPSRVSGGAAGRFHRADDGLRHAVEPVSASSERRGSRRGAAGPY